LARGGVKQPLIAFHEGAHAGGVVDTRIKKHWTIVFFVLLIEIHGKAPWNSFPKAVHPDQFETGEFDCPTEARDMEDDLDFREAQAPSLELLAQFLVRDRAVRFSVQHLAPNDGEPFHKRFCRIASEP
jgi:hypothetical protein